MNKLKVGIGMAAVVALLWVGSMAWATFQINTKSILPVPGTIDFKAYQFADITSTQGLTSSVMDFGGARMYYVSCKIKIKQWQGQGPMTWQFVSADDALMTTNIRFGALPVTYTAASGQLGQFKFEAWIDKPQQYAVVSKTAQNTSNVIYDQECDAVPVR